MTSTTAPAATAPTAAAPSQAPRRMKKPSNRFYEALRELLPKRIYTRSSLLLYPASPCYGMDWLSRYFAPEHPVSVADPRVDKLEEAKAKSQSLGQKVMLSKLANVKAFDMIIVEPEWMEKKTSSSAMVREAVLPAEDGKSLDEACAGIPIPPRTLVVILPISTPSEDPRKQFAKTLLRYKLDFATEVAGCAVVYVFRSLAGHIGAPSS